MNPNTSTLPLLFREALGDAGMVAIDDWWKHLDSGSRVEALQLWDDCQQTNHALSIRIEGSYADESDHENSGFWHKDLYDFLVNHEIYVLRERKFHVCTQHPLAAAVVRAGTIPHDFSCPLATANCPMRRLLGQAPGRALNLRVVLTRESPAVPG